MTHTQAIQSRERLRKRLPATGEVLRGSLIERTTPHASGCPKPWRRTSSNNSDHKLSGRPHPCSSASMAIVPNGRSIRSPCCRRRDSRPQLRTVEVLRREEWRSGQRYDFRQLKHCARKRPSGGNLAGDANPLYSPSFPALFSRDKLPSRI